MTVQPNIVLVHGAWADGSCWTEVIERLQASGYAVTAPQFPESSLAADVARLRQVLARQDGPVILAGHSYGGQIMTALGTDGPNVAGLVYIAAFGLDEGESIGAMLGQGPPTPALAHLDIDAQGFERVRHAQLFRDGHAAARGLFAITHCGVEKEHSIEDFVLAHRGATLHELAYYCRGSGSIDQIYNTSKNHNVCLYNRINLDTTKL